MDGVLYGCSINNTYGPCMALRPLWFHTPETEECGSPSESFSLFSFWLGRDSDTMLQWPPEPEPIPDFTFAYLEQD